MSPFSLREQVALFAAAADKAAEGLRMLGEAALLAAGEAHRLVQLVEQSKAVQPARGFPAVVGTKEFPCRCGKVYLAEGEHQWREPDGGPLHGLTVCEPF